MHTADADRATIDVLFAMLNADLSRDQKRCADLRAQLLEQRTVGMAIGVLMGTHQVGDLAASAMLEHLARTDGKSEFEMAQEIKGAVVAASTGSPPSAPA